LTELRALVDRRKVKSAKDWRVIVSVPCKYFCPGLGNLKTSHNSKVSIISFTLSEVHVSFLLFSLSNGWIITVLKSPPTSKSWSLKVSKLVSSVFKKRTSSLFIICLICLKYFLQFLCVFVAFYQQLFLNIPVHCTYMTYL